jgi:RNA-splicing ligase RtcB
MPTYKKKKNEKQKIYLIAVILLIFIMVLVNLGSNKENTQISESEEDITQEEEENQTEENIIAKLKDMEERDRMEYYLSEFLEYVENKNYEKAYDLLYTDFKENYFPTLESFEEYAEKTFPEMAEIRHDNIERNGDVYVLWIYITDVLNGKPGDEKEMNIVIQENDYNDFVMSFSVI